MDEINDSGNTEINSEADADALLESIDNPAKEAPPPAPIEQFAFKHNGKEVKGSREEVLRWASQGYDAPTQIGDWKKKANDLMARETELKGLESKYKGFDEYVRKNPDFYTKFTEAYQQDIAGNPMSELEPLKREIDSIKQWSQTLEKEREQDRIKLQDEFYNKELDELKKAYPKVDFSSKDATGKSLEYKVLNHAQENGIKKFTTAFRDFYHDDIIKMTEEAAKEKVVSSKQARIKLGILDSVQFPTGKTEQTYNRNKSWNDLEKEALAELGNY